MPKLLNPCLVFLLMMLIGLEAAARKQSMYELSCRLPGHGNIQGKALLVLEADGGGFVRLAWTDPKRKERVITDLDIAGELTMTFPDFELHPSLCERKTLKCISAIPRKNVKGKAVFPAEVFMFWFEDKGDGFVPYTGNLPRFDSSRVDGEDFYDRYYYRPFFISHGGFKPEFLGCTDPPNLLKVRELSGLDLDCSLLSGYFTPTEQACRFAGNIAGLGEVRRQDRASLICITVTDVNEPEIAQTTQIDRDGIDSFFRRAARMIPMNYQRILLENADFRASALDSVIRSLQAGPDDVIILAYSGHGFSYSNDKEHPYPQLALWSGTQSAEFFRGNSVNLETVFEGICAKGSRLNIVIGDCCNTDAEITRKVDSQQYAQSGISVMQLRARRNYRRLLKESRGSYIACAAQQGEAAACDTSTGGFFTNNFIRCMDELIKSSEIPDTANCWSRIFESTRLQAKADAARCVCELPDIRCKQSMLYKKVQALPATVGQKFHAADPSKEIPASH